MNIPSYGIVYDSRFKDIVDENYTKNGNFSICKLALYSENFENNDIIPKLQEKLEIDLNQNINPISNIRALKHMHINFERLIFFIKQNSVVSREKMVK